MNKTGQTFEMNPETFTLQNVFAMELHRFQETIGDIVNCAVKELAIEKVSLPSLLKGHVGREMLGSQVVLYLADVNGTNGRDRSFSWCKS